MELRITNPEENGFLKEIQWNQEEVKSWVAARVQDYKTIAYTADQAKDMKRDRADLNKLKAAFEDERKRLKKACMEPYNRFEQQVKEITALIDEPIQLIDSQLSEIEERRKQLKQKEIEDLFGTIGFQDFITLEIMSIDLQTALDKDMAVIHEDGTTDYVDTQPEQDNVVADQELQEVKEQKEKEEPAESRSIEDEFFQQ